MNKLVAIIVSFNRAEKLSTSVQQCLINGVDHIIIVDNNSEQDVLNYLNSIVEYEKVSIIFNDTNNGASKAFWQAVEHLPLVCELQDSNVVFLDDDSYISTSFKNKLPSIKGFMSPAVLNLEGCLLKMNLPLLSIPSSLLDVLMYLYKRPTPKIGQSVSIQSASFVGLTMNAAIAYKYRYLIPVDFFIYFDDVYFTLKLSELGVDGYYDPNLEVVHDTTDTRRIGSQLTIYYLFRNAVITHREMTRWWWLIVFFKIISYGSFIVSSKRECFSKLRAVIKGVVSGVKYLYVRGE